MTHEIIIFDILESNVFLKKKYSTCWVFQAFFCSNFFTSFFEKHPSSALTAVHRLYHNNAPKVRDALYIYTTTIIIFRCASIS